MSSSPIMSFLLATAPSQRGLYVAGGVCHKRQTSSQYKQNTKIHTHTNTQISRFKAPFREQMEFVGSRRLSTILGNHVLQVSQSTWPSSMYVVYQSKQTRIKNCYYGGCDELYSGQQSNLVNMTKSSHSISVMSTKIESHKNIRREWGKVKSNIPNEVPGLNVELLAIGSFLIGG